MLIQNNGIKSSLVACLCLAAITLVLGQAVMPRISEPNQIKQIEKTAEELAVSIYSIFYDQALRNAQSIVLDDNFIIEVGDGIGQSYQPTLNQLIAMGLAPDHANGAEFRIKRIPENCKGAECNIQAYMLRNGITHLVYSTP